jgi:hypothetical protein
LPPQTLLDVQEIIASPAFIVMKAADQFKDKTTTAPSTADHRPRHDDKRPKRQQAEYGRVVAGHLAPRPALKPASKEWPEFGLRLLRPSLRN